MVSINRIYKTEAYDKLEAKKKEQKLGWRDFVMQLVEEKKEG